MAQYRKKPVTIEAVQIPKAGGTFAEMPDWLQAAATDGTLVADSDGSVTIRTLEGTVRGGPGDWVLRGVKGELYPCRDDIFRDTYETA